jgi:hypothetical protein
VLGNKQTWRDDIATSIAKTIFNNQYAPDPSDPRRILLVASDGTIPAAKGPQAATTIWRGAVIFKFLPPDRYIASNQGGTEFWVLSESEVPTVSGSGQSQFAVVAYPSTVQTVLGSDPTYKLSAVTNPNIAA